MTDWFLVVRRYDSAALRDLDDIDIRNDDGESLLHAAIAYSNTDTALYLIGRGIQVNVQDTRGRTPLHYCAAYQNLPVTLSVLECGGEIRITDEHGNSALWTAVFNARGKYEIVEAMIRKGCKDAVTQENRQGRSPLDFAKQINDTHLETILTSDK